MTRLRHFPTHSRRWATALLVLCAACYTSASPRRAANFNAQKGETVTVHLTNGRSRVGELLGVRDSSLVLLVENRVVMGRLADVGDVAFERTPWRSIRPGTSAAVERIARVSRFPFGVTESALTELLVQTKQTAPDPLVGQRP